MDGGSELQGRVEICWNRVWGAVANRRWTFQEAKIICTQLGYSSECEYSSSQYKFVMPLEYNSASDCDPRKINLSD